MTRDRRSERLNGSRYISARTFIEGKVIRRSTRETTEREAVPVARAWYETLIAKKVLTVTPLG